MVSRLKQINRATWIKLGVGFALIFAVSIVVRFTALRELLSINYVIQWVSEIRESPWRLPIFFLIFVVGVCALPITIFPIIGGVLFKFWFAFPLNILAATTGAFLAFGVARIFGRDAVETILRGRLKNFDRAATEKGFRTVLILRLTGIPPFIVSNYALGLSGVHVGAFLAATAIGMTPWMLLVTYAADSLWKAVLISGEEGLTRALFKALAPVFAMSIAVILAVLVTFLIRRRKAKENYSNL